MRDPASWERISRLRDGELSEEEARALEAGPFDASAVPSLEEALRRLDEIDEAARLLGTGLELERAEAIVASVLPPPSPRWPRRWVAAAAIAASIAVVFAVWERPRGSLLVHEGPVELAGRELRAGEGASALVRLPSGSLLVGQNSRVVLGDPVRLESGTVAAWGDGIRVEAAGAEVRFDGTGFATLEPSEALDRATAGRAISPEGGTMKLWGKLGPAVAGVLAGGAATFLVLDGTAEVKAGAVAPVQLAAGERAIAGRDGVQLASARSALVASAAEPGRERKEPRPDEPPAAGAEPATMSREALIAEVVRLRDEREALLRDYHRTARQLEEAGSRGGGRGTYYRLSHEQLVADAEKGRVRLRLPHVYAPPGERMWSSEVTDDLALTQAEEAALKAVYDSSAQRIRGGLGALYVEIGGDPEALPELDAPRLFMELQRLSREDELKEAVRVAANERAGIVPLGTGGSAAVRALRLLWQEDDRVVEEVERILGPARAQRFLDHEKTSHADASFEVGAGR